jgi:flagellin
MAFTDTTARKSCDYALDADIDTVTSARATWGASQNRFESVINNLRVGAENSAAARGRIVDADYAMETANLSRAQVLQQAGTAMVAQANQAPQGVLALLR